MCIYKVYTKEKGLVETNNHFDFSDLTCHKDDGPAYIRYDENCNIEYEVYCVNGKIHRLNGPAYIKYDVNNNIIRYEYWINDIKYRKDQYEKELLKLKVNSL